MHRDGGGADVRLPHLDRRAPRPPRPSPRRRGSSSTRRQSTSSTATSTRRQHRQQHQQRHRQRRTVTGDVAQTQWGPVQVAAHRRRRARSPRSRCCSTPAATRRTSEINYYALPILIQETLDARARTSTWSAARPSPASATCSRCRARSTRRACDRDRSTGPAPRRARDGHAGQRGPARPARRRRAGRRRLGRGRGRPARRRPGLQHLPRRTRSISRLGRGELASTTARPRSPRCSPSASAPRGESGGAFDVRRPGAGRRAPRPQRRGEGLGGGARGRSAFAASTTPTSASRPAATWSCTWPTPTGPTGGSASRTRRTRPGSRRRPRAFRRGRDLGPGAPRRARRRRAYRSRADPAGVGHRARAGPDPRRRRGDHRARDGRRRTDVAGRRAGLTAYLQWADGRTQTLVGLPD